MIEILESILRYVEEAGQLGPFLFVAIYVIGCVLLIPGFFMTSAAGLLFGFPRGFLYVSLSVLLGATAGFVIARYVGSEWVQRKMAAHPHLYKLERIIERGGWQVVALVRLCPVFPFRLSNYAFGFTRIKFGPFLFGTWIGTIPSSLTYTYVGSTITSLRDLYTGQGGDAAGITAFMGGLALALLTYLLLKLSKGALNRLS